MLSDFAGVPEEVGHSGSSSRHLKVPRTSPVLLLLYFGPGCGRLINVHPPKKMTTPDP